MGRRRQKLGKPSWDASRVGWRGGAARRLQALGGVGPITTTHNSNRATPAIKSRSKENSLSSLSLSPTLGYLCRHSTPSRSIFFSIHQLSLEDMQLFTNTFLVTVGRQDVASSTYHLIESLSHYRKGKVVQMAR
jgi:hypothetical protein